MITFRLPADEYERCRELCYTRGLSSVSGMARAAINLLMRDPSSVAAQTLETRVADLEGRVRVLSLEMKHLNHESAPQESEGVPAAPKTH